MIPFQYGGIFVCLVIAAWGVVRFRRTQRPGWVSLMAVTLGAIGAVTIFDPELTTRIARRLGIARGADLLIYLVALAFLGSWFYFYQKLRTLSNALTAVVRELAIRDARVPPAAAGMPPDNNPPERDVKN